MKIFKSQVVWFGDGLGSMIAHVYEYFPRQFEFVGYLGTVEVTGRCYRRHGKWVLSKHGCSSRLARLLFS